MNNYAELDKIREKYACKGDLIFRTAIFMIVEHGRSLFQDESFIANEINAIDDRHDAAEAKGKKPMIMTREFEKAFTNCAHEISYIDVVDLVNYIKTEVYFGGDGIDYQRAIHLLQNCISWIITVGTNDRDAYDDLMAVGFDSTELEELGYDFELEKEEW